MNQIAIEVLVKQREVLILRRSEMIAQINGEISDIEAGIETLSGKKVWEMQPLSQYEDEKVGYIQGTEDGI